MHKILGRSSKLMEIAECSKPLAYPRPFRAVGRLKDLSPSAAPHPVIMKMCLLQPYKAYSGPSLPCCLLTGP